MHTEMVVHNPHATKPLRYGLDVVCNVSDEVILKNCLTNALKVKQWMRTLPAHDRTVLLCGSGPSIADDIETIRTMQEDGAEVWALNNCANYLTTVGIVADAQIIMDAQPVTIKAIGPAKNHYFASQCDPSLFDAVPDAILWHSTHGNVYVDEQEGFPDYDGEYCLIGSAVSVGNTAMVLAFSQGFRDIHLFGFDSSNKGVSHVVHQPWNDGEPMTINEFAGKQYVSSLTMSLQADAFPSRAWVLQREGCKLTVHGYGLLPDRWNNPITEEQKYEMLWQRGDYGLQSPGSVVVDEFLSIVKPKEGATIADFGCGSGKASLAIEAKGAFDITCVDFVDFCRDAEAEHFKFIKANLSNDSLPLHVEHGFCSDVMEHIPPELVDQTINNIMGSCDDCFFQISTVPDSFCGAVGRPLHLTVERLDWWRNKFVSLGYTVRYECELSISVLFHVSSTGDSK